MSGPSSAVAPPDIPNDSAPGRRLRPMTAGVLRQALQFYRAGDPDFVGEYFPNIAARGYSTYDDVFSTDARQAEALVPILEASIRRFLFQDGRERSRNTHLLERTPIDPNFESGFAKRARMWTEALRDLCQVYGLPCPL
jgi:hypothetical protein